MTCQCCGTVDNRHGQGPVTVFTAEGLCTVCRTWFIRIAMEHNVSARFLGVRRRLG